MRIPLVIIILLVIVCTLFISENHTKISFDLFLFEANIYMSYVLGGMFLVGFFLGMQIYIPKKIHSPLNSNLNKDVPLEINNLEVEDLEYIDYKSKNKLSDEDKDYIS